MGKTIIRSSPVSGETGLTLGIYPGIKNTQYKYVVGNDDFKVGMYHTESVMDMASPLYILLASKFLAEHGYEKCIEQVDYFCKYILELDISSRRLSRMDLFCDSDELFLTPAHLKYFIRTSKHADFHTPATEDDYEKLLPLDAKGFERYRQFTGFTFGRRGKSIYSRVYLKKTEIRVSEKDYLLQWWQDMGLRIEKDIWRVEFELKRQQLKDLGITEFSQLNSESLNVLWEYLTSKCLRFIQAKNKWHTERTKPRKAWKKIQAVKFIVKNTVKFTEKMPQAFEATVNQIYGLLSKLAVDYSQIHQYGEAVGMDFAIDIVRNYYAEQKFTDKVKEKENRLASNKPILERYHQG